MGTVALCCLCILLGAAFGAAAWEEEGAAAFLGLVFMVFLVTLGGWLAN